MLQDIVRTLIHGDDHGNKMIAEFTLPSGLRILGLPTENNYGGNWDLGPTWNYLVLGEEPFLVDAGKSGSGPALLQMMQEGGFSPKDLSFIVLSHGHEDHDGGLQPILQTTGARVKAHWIYERLSRLYPRHAPTDGKRAFPASCWHCFMPESFSSEYCSQYHKERSTLAVDCIGDHPEEIAKGVTSFFVPGHSPDALALFVNQEVLIVGDTVLPHITPIPSQKEFLEAVGPVLGPGANPLKPVYGLKTYIQSLKSLRDLALQFPELVVLPAHRTYYGGQWNPILLAQRIDELLEHHVRRCGAIIEILGQGPGDAKSIAQKHFEPSLLKGFGIYMAEHEIRSHCELLVECGDLALANHNGYAATGTLSFESVIRSLTSDG